MEEIRIYKEIQEELEELFPAVHAAEMRTLKELNNIKPSAFIVSSARFILKLYLIFPEFLFFLTS